MNDGQTQNNTVFISSQGNLKWPDQAVELLFFIAPLCIFLLNVVIFKNLIPQE
jgi:hypothetical protein